MGDRQGRMKPGGGILLNGILPGEDATATQFLDAERWSLAEERTAQLIACIQPNKPSEERRHAVANYVQRLITQSFSCEVFTFGSVPLKTYLPDGDIDLTAFSQNTDSKDTWANAVLKVLENEEKSETAEFHVKEVQYIQAEVKIIKCLVENIVVDISFNQLGGLCTLCFLDEVDHLINQDHMFKRSIILIKAWCYYESRILGAHHGLISTYALETLVLYIFHVFNNSFSGPLEVLFRFLEFFSKFDWENFCVSLSGPVPINSLPDMTAECPRKDGGELLLNKLFLNGCSSVYAVYPHGQENQGQPFVSKHFNVVDPLRTNNNLGRSVSKGNFYRIRSAFAFGAKRLAGMLSCPKENIVVEVDKFFLNTWNRHGTGKRPDAPVCSVSLQLPPSNITPVPYVDKLQNSASTKHMAESYRLIANHRNSGAVVNDVASVPVNSANGTGQSLDKNVDTNILDSSIGYGLQAMSGMANHIHRNVSANEFVYTEMLRKNLRPGHFYPSGQGRFQFARTHSSPELTDPSHGILTPQIGVAETENKQSGCLKEKSSKDSSSPKYSCAHSGAGMVPDTSSDHDDAVFLNTKEHASVSQNLELRQEEQDFVNTMPSSRFHGYNGQYQQTIQCSPHPPIHSQLSAAAYSQRTIGAIPGNMPPVETRWGSNIQLHQVLVPSPASGYFGNAHLDSNASETGEYTNDRSSTTSIDLDNGDHGFSHDLDVALSRGFASENRKSQVPSADDRKVPSAGVNFPPCSEGNSKFHNLRGQSRFIRETGRPLKSDHLDISMIRNPRENGPYSHNRSENFRPANYTKAGFSKKLGSESWDGPMAKGSKFSREKRGRKIPSSTEVPSSYARKSGWSSESSSVDGVPACTDDYGHGGVLNHEPNADDLAQQSIDSSAQMSVNHQVAGPDQMFMSGSDPVFPVTPMIVYGNPRPRRGSSSGMGSVAVNFFQTGPPVPFYVVQYKGPPDPPTSDASVEQFNEIDSSHLTSSVRSLDLTDRSEEHDPVLPSTSVEDAFEKFPEGNKDILYSDFSSHWQNLQYGRLCQDSNIPGPPVYPSPLVVPPMYLQGQFQWDGPGRPGPTIAPLMNYAHRLVPFVPLHPGPNRPDVCQRYGDETHRFRSGTGTYLPKTKLPYRERQSSIPRNNRGNHNYERYNNGDREGSWVNQKSRISYNNPGRHQHDRPNTRTDRSLPVDSQPGRSWDTHETERVPSNRHNTALISSNSNDISSTMAYSMYPLASVSSSNVNAGASVPSLMMLYQYDSSIGYRSPEQVEFGSIGSVHLGGLNEMQHAGSANALRGSSENRGDGYQQGSASSSPDQPSSPQFHSRRI